MNFVAALKCGATPEVEARRCMYQLLGRYRPQDRLDLVSTADFINELYKAIGMQTNITAQQLETGESFDWDSAFFRHYIFNCNALFLSAFERFLAQLSRTVIEELASVEYKGVQLYLELMGKWSNSCTDLLRLGEDIQVPFLVEPLARINYILFLGVQEIRKKFDVDLHVNTICTTLLDSAMQGLFFEECHTYIAAGLSKIIERDFAMSMAFNKDAFKFFLVVFTVDKHKATHCEIFKCIGRMMHARKVQKDTSNLRHLVSFLITPSMMETYYTFLMVEKTKRILYETLHFLNKLMTHVSDLSCFSQTFIEAILRLVLHTNEDISLYAGKLYIKMANCKAIGDDYILMHILEFYFREKTTAVGIPHYINALWEEFPYMQSMKIYFELLRNSDIILTLRYFIAHFSSVVYTKMLEPQVCDNYFKEFHYVYETLPTLLDELNSECLKGILLQLYSFTKDNLRSEHSVNLHELLPKFEDYFVATFIGDSDLNYPYLNNLVIQFAQSIKKTKNVYKIKKCGGHIYARYVGIEHLLKKLGTKKASSRQITAYCNILEKLFILMHLEYYVSEHLVFIMKTLHARLIETKQIHEFAKKENKYIDIYAIMLLVNSCIQLSRYKNLSKSSSMWLIGVLSNLETYLLNFLSEAGSKTNLQLYRVKTYYHCLLMLYYTFYNTTNEYKLSLNMRSYHVLVETLVVSCLRRKPELLFTDENNMELHSNSILDYQKSMFTQFTQLHLKKNMVLPSPVAWKLCLHYGLVSHNFSAELCAFMKVLAKYHFKVFTHILVVSVYNLYKQKPPFTMGAIKSVIRQQKSFIDQLPPAYTPSLICANVVLRVLQILKQSLEILPPTSGRNRLEALKHLDLFTKNLNINENNVLTDIRTKANALQDSLLNDDERMCLRDYLRLLKAYVIILK